MSKRTWKNFAYSYVPSTEQYKVRKQKEIENKILKHQALASISEEEKERKAAVKNTRSVFNKLFMKSASPEHKKGHHEMRYANYKKRLENFEDNLPNFESTMAEENVNERQNFPNNSELTTRETILVKPTFTEENRLKMRRYYLEHMNMNRYPEELKTLVRQKINLANKANRLVIKNKNALSKNEIYRIQNFGTKITTSLGEPIYTKNELERNIQNFTNFLSRLEEKLQVNNSPVSNNYKFPFSANNVNINYGTLKNESSNFSQKHKAAKKKRRSNELLSLSPEERNIEALKTQIRIYKQKYNESNNENARSEYYQKLKKTMNKLKEKNNSYHNELENYKSLITTPQQPQQKEFFHSTFGFPVASYFPSWYSRGGKKKKTKSKSKSKSGAKAYKSKTKSKSKK